MIDTVNGTGADSRSRDKGFKLTKGVCCLLVPFHLYFLKIPTLKVKQFGHSVGWGCSSEHLKHLLNPLSCIISKVYICNDELRDHVRQ